MKYSVVTVGDPVWQSLQSWVRCLIQSLSKVENSLEVLGTGLTNLAGALFYISCLVSMHNFYAVWRHIRKIFSLTHDIKYLIMSSCRLITGIADTKHSEKGTNKVKFCWGVKRMELKWLAEDFKGFQYSNSLRDVEHLRRTECICCRQRTYISGVSRPRHIEVLKNVMYQSEYCI